MGHFRIFAFILGVLTVMGCAGPAPKEAAISDSLGNSIIISSVSVDVSALGGQTEGRPYPVAEVKRIFEDTGRSELIDEGAGTRRVQVIVRLASVKIIDAAQSVMIGGESVTKGTILIADARTGQVLMQPQEVTAGGGGWVLGGLMAAASLESEETEVRQMAEEFFDRSKVIIFGG